MALVGNTVRLFAEFRTFEGVLSDPTDITLTVYDGEDSYVYSGASIIKDSIGVYRCDFTIPSGRGALRYEWEAELEGSPIRAKDIIKREQ